jgi:hypothetical protein
VSDKIHDVIPVGGHPDWAVVSYWVGDTKNTYLSHMGCGWLPDPASDDKCCQCRGVAPKSAVSYVLLNKLAGGII